MRTNYKMDDGGELWKWITHNMPFMALMASNAPQNRPLLTRIMEQSAVGVIAAAAVLWANDKVQDKALESNKESINKIEKRIDKLEERIELLRNEIQHLMFDKK